MNDIIASKPRPNYVGSDSVHLVRRVINGEVKEWVTKDNPFSTPWGRAQRITIFKRGFRFVTTASHGGFMISAKLAELRLSAGAKHFGQVYGGYICFEEDSLFSIIQFEFPSVAKVMTGREISLEELAEDLGKGNFTLYCELNNITLNSNTTYQVNAV